MARTAQTRVGFAGAGIIGSRHLGNLMGFEDVQVVAFADPALERARELAARCGGKAYDDLARMLDSEKLDALYVCIPPFAHGDPERVAIERGLPFFVEKPLAADLKTAEVVGREVEAGGIVTSTGYHWRYLAITGEARK